MQIFNYKYALKFVYIALIFIGVSNLACARNDNNLTNYDKPDCSLILKTAAIETCKSVERIEKLSKNFNVERENIKSDSTEGGVIEKFKTDSRVAVIKVTYFGEMGKRIMKFYFDEKSSPIFTLDSTVNYDRPMYVGGKKIQSVEKTHFVYNKSSLSFIPAINNDEDKKNKEKLDYVNKIFKELVSK